MFSTFCMGRVASGRGLISIEYYSELLNRFSENWNVQLFNFLTRDLVILEYSIDITQSPFADENMESLLTIAFGVRVRCWYP